MFNLWGRKNKKPNSQDQPVVQQQALLGKTMPPSRPIATSGVSNEIAEQKSPDLKRNKSGLSQTDIDELRQLEFKELGIPYEAVIGAEAKGVRRINPNNLARETQTVNAKLRDQLGFNLRVSCLELFQCQLLFLDYQKLRQETQKAKGVALPGHNLIEIIVLREAERLIRLQRRIGENPITGDEAKTFQAEVKKLFDLTWSNSLAFQLRKQAVNQLRREKKMAGNEPLREIEVKERMEEIQAGRQATRTSGR